MYKESSGVSNLAGMYLFSAIFTTLIRIYGVLSLNTRLARTTKLKLDMTQKYD